MQYISPQHFMEEYIYVLHSLLSEITPNPNLKVLEHAYYYIAL
jgi:hypothetical protein